MRCRIAPLSCLAIRICIATTLLLGGCTSLTDREASLPPPLIDSLGEDDMRLADQALQQALSVAISGTTFVWRNDSNGYSGTVTPKQSFRAEDGVYCREYTETVTVERRSELYANTACVDDSGVWKSLR